MMSKAEVFCRGVDRLSNWCGKVVSVIVVIMVVTIMFEVLMRYVFNKPTIWVWDINLQLLAVIGVMGASYALLNKGHVTIDLLTTRFSEKMKAILHLVASPFFFLFLGLLLWKVISKALISIDAKEVYASVFAPPLYPLRVLIVIGIILLILQAIADFIRDVKAVADSKSGAL